MNNYRETGETWDGKRTRVASEVQVQTDKKQ